jgi:hypothetical protein
MRSPVFLLTLWLALAITPALAQGAPKEVRINVMINMSQTLSSDDQSSAIDRQTQARKTVYDLASNECKLLLETIASECRLESLNVNSGEQNQYYRGDASNMVTTTTSNATFRIQLKD